MSDLIKNSINSRTLDDAPQYFGAYLNIARHNLFVISNHIAHKFDLKTKKGKSLILEDDEFLPNSFLTCELRDNQKLTFTQIVRFLPIAKVYASDMLPKDDIGKPDSEIDYKLLAEGLEVCFSELNKFRNSYTHYYSIKNGVNRKRKIKETLSDFLKINYARAIEYTKKRFEAFNESDFDLSSKTLLVNEHNEITQEGLLFFICLFLDRENAFHFISRVIGFKNSTTSPFKATREVFCAFCVKLPHDKFISEDPKQAYILDMFNELNKCPVELYNNLNEESKKHFQPNFEKEQLTNIEDNSVPTELAIDEYEKYITEITSRKRHRDRFSEFALKFLDNKSDFELNFHLNLGKVCLNSYDKQFLGANEKREIISDVKVFGKLNSFQVEEESITIIYKRKKIEFTHFYPHFHIKNNKIAFSFNINSKVTIDSDEKDKKVIVKLSSNNPDGFFSVYELPKVILLELLNSGKVTEIVKQFIDTSLNHIHNESFIKKVKDELDGFPPFYKKTQKKNLHAYENVSIIDYKERKERLGDTLRNLQNRKEKLDALLKEFSLNHKQIPKRILYYWLNIKDAKKDFSVAERIKAMRKDCKNRIKAIEKNKAPKIGEMATYLARDIVKMVIDEDTKNKITSFYYDKIQECLAIFADPDKKRIFNDICAKELNLFNNQIGHPFLADLNPYEISNTSEFYEKYLQRKGYNIKEVWNNNSKKTQKTDKSWLRTKFYVKEKNSKTDKWEEKVQFPDDLSTIPLSMRKWLKEKSSFEQWLSNIKNGCTEKDNKKPVDLPVNLFDEAICIELKQELNNQNIAFEENDKFAKLVTLFFKEDIQPFYKEDRAYVIYDEKVSFKLGTESSFKKYFKDALSIVYKRESEKRNADKRLPQIQKNDILRVFNNAITENEKRIRFYQTKDRVLNMMIKSLINSENEFDFKLKDIHPLSIKSPLNHEELIRETIKGKLYYDENGNRINDEQLRPEIKRVIIDKRKRKDYSIFRRFVSDKRLPELFEYFDEKEITYATFKNELEEYNKYKELIFDLVFNIEKDVIEKIGISALNPPNNSDNIQHDVYLTWLKENNIIDSETQLFMKVTRNAFSHSQFPPKIIMKIVRTEGVSLTEQIYVKYQTVMEKLRLNIENHQISEVKVSK